MSGDTPSSTPSTPKPTVKPAPAKAPVKPTAAAEAKPAPKAEAKPAAKTAPKATSEGEVRAPRRATLEKEEVRLLAVRRSQDRRRPKFVRTASHRYWRIGRWESWRAPTGIQSKQRRHYGYRPTVVSIGFRGPAAVRGRTPTGFVPVIIHNATELEEADRSKEAAIIARTVGTRRRLVLEELARKKGLKVLNPILKEELGGEEDSS